MDEVPATREARPAEVVERHEAPDANRVSLARMTDAAKRGLNATARPAVLSHRVLESLYRQEPLLQRGIKKQTGDLVKHGFRVIQPGSDEQEHDGDDVVQAWFRDGFIFPKVREALIAAHVHGDGYLEIEWDDGGSGEDPVQEGAMPVDVHVVDPVDARFLEDEDSSGEDVVFLVQDRDGERVVLHPNRYHHFRFTTLPGFLHGIATTETAYHAAIAKVKGDQALGELLYFSGTPKLFAAVKNAVAGELEQVQAMLSEPAFVRGFAWHDRAAVTQLNPGTVNPQPFYAEFKSSIAAAIGLPVAMLEGVQAGAVTGSETNLTDYHSDLLQAKVTVLEPFVVRIVAPVLKQPISAFDVTWNEPPVSPGAMATRARDQATAFTLLKDAGLTKEAAARVVGLELADDDFEEEPEEPVPPPFGTLPPVKAPPPGLPPPQPGARPEQPPRVVAKR